VAELEIDRPTGLTDSKSGTVALFRGPGRPFRPGKFLLRLPQPH
jgi:hypothetical protein